MFERFTPSARTIVVRAVEEARRTASPRIRAAHLLIALCADSALAGETLRAAGVSAHLVRSTLAVGAGTIDRDALLSIGIDLDEVRRTIEENFGPGALDGAARENRRGLGRRRGGGRAGRLPFDAGGKATLQLSLREAVQLGSGSLAAEHLLLGLLLASDPEVSTTLAQADVSPEELRNAVLQRLQRSA